MRLTKKQESELLNFTAHSIYAYTEPISMAYQFDGLRDLVKRKLKREPDSGELFLFHNRAHTYIKILTFNKGGWVIIAKKLERGQFEVDAITRKMSINGLTDLVNLSLISLKKAA